MDFNVPAQALNCSLSGWSAASQVPRLCDCEEKGSELPSFAQIRCKAKRDLSTPPPPTTTLNLSAVCPHLHVFNCIRITDSCWCIAMFPSTWWNKIDKRICLNLLFSSQVIKCWPSYQNNYHWTYWLFVFKPRYWSGVKFNLVKVCDSSFLYFRSEIDYPLCPVRLRILFLLDYLIYLF